MGLEGTVLSEISQAEKEGPVIAVTRGTYKRKKHPSGKRTCRLVVARGRGSGDCGAQHCPPVHLKAAETIDLQRSHCRKINCNSALQL